MTENPEILTVDQVADKLHIRRSTVQDYARRGRLPGFKVGRQWLFLAEDIRAAIEDLRVLHRR
jgi:excisionase family DNA binding protein